jgi:hypothetical protein
MADLQKREMIRRVRLGNVRTLIQHRCGHTLPDDDAGQEYLIEMLKIISLGPDPERKMVNVVEVFAPFMNNGDAEKIIVHVKRMLTWERWPKAKILGESLRLTNAERERFGLWAIAPCDISEEDLAEQRKAKERARKARYRQRKKEMQSRAEYLATHSINRTKPWLAEGISKATFYRRKKEREQGNVPTGSDETTVSRIPS